MDQFPNANSMGTSASVSCANKADIDLTSLALQRDLSSILCRSLSLDADSKTIKNAVFRNKSKIDMFSLEQKLTIRSNTSMISIGLSGAESDEFDFRIAIINFTMSGCLPIGTIRICASLLYQMYYLLIADPTVMFDDLFDVSSIHLIASFENIFACSCVLTLDKRIFAIWNCKEGLADLSPVGPVLRVLEEVLEAFIMTETLAYRPNVCPICLVCLVCAKSYSKECACPYAEIYWNKRRDGYQLDFCKNPLTQAAATIKKIKFDKEFVRWFHSNYASNFEVPPNLNYINICRECNKKYKKKGT
ncbi:16660_t:CDS:2 [Gigaspora rosea]|nr:16660_t:CDS:2 [Gigaspora rosea]